jgi:hypothetical protein
MKVNLSKQSETRDYLNNRASHMLKNSKFIPWNRGAPKDGCFYNNSSRYCLGDLWKIDNNINHNKPTVYGKFGNKEFSKRKPSDLYFFTDRTRTPIRTL